MKREKAVAVGNRAGIVEWANAAWSRVTGYALEDAISKPVGDLLSLAGIGPDVVDFVRRRFERGEACEIELPLDPPDGGRRWIHVSVESLRDRHGEVSHFAAIAWDVTSERQRATRPSVTAPATGVVKPRGRNLALPLPVNLTTTEVSAFVREIVGREATGGAARTVFDMALTERLPAVAIDTTQVTDTLAGFLSDAAAAIGEEWGTVSISTGLARSEAVFVSPTYPRDCLLRGLPEGFYVYVEIHDTGPPVDRTAVAAVSGGAGEARGRVARLAGARRLMRAHGGALRIDADAGFGTRVILLFPA